MNMAESTKQVLNTRPNLDETDEIYQLLIEAHQDLDDVQSQRLNARLILFLFNHIGDKAVIKQALKAAQSR